MAQIITSTPNATVSPGGGPCTYVEYGPRETIPPPFESKGGSFLGVALKGNQTMIQGLVDRVLNTPAGGKVHYQALTSYVILQVGSFTQLRSKIAPAKGYVPETQLTLWVALEQTVGADRVCLTAPFIFVDNPMSLLSGRDDFGYPKALAQFAPAAWEKQEIEVQVFGGNYGQNSTPAWQRLITITREGVAPASLGPEETPIEVAQKLADLAQPAGPDSLVTAVASFIEELILGNVKQVFLKQFRDVATSTDACYQKVVEAVCKVANVRPHVSIDEWHVNLVDLESHPIVAELGLEKEQTTKLAFEVDMDVILELGQVVAP